MDFTEYVRDFEKILQDDPETSAAVASIKVLLEFIRRDSSKTVQELMHNCKSLISVLTENDFSVTSVKSATELFIRFITLTPLDHPNFNDCRNVLVERGNMFLEKTHAARNKIAKIGHPFIYNNSKVLVHSHSRVVYYAIMEAYRAKKNFLVYVTESAPDYSGRKMYDKLTAAGINATLILDSAVGYILEKVDMVLFGAEGVVENGGIINKIGSYTIGVCAHALNKPVYVLAESFKFMRSFPLNQRDLSDTFKYLPSKRKTADLSKEHPLVDYTPPAYITLLFTDLHILTTAAVGEEIFKMYL